VPHGYSSREHCGVGGARGGLENDESDVEALARELLEEVGLLPPPTRLPTRRYTLNCAEPHSSHCRHSINCWPHRS